MSGGAKHQQGVRMSWMDRKGGWRHVVAMLLATCAPWAAQAGEWVLEDAVGVPGETVQVPVFFRAGTQAVATTATVFLQSPLGVRPPGPLAQDGAGSCGANLYGDVEASIDTRGQAAGTLIRVCSFPVTVPNHFRVHVPMTVRVDECIGTDAQPAVCSAGSGARFLIDTEPRWYERAAVIVPKPAPRGPTQQALLDFDYAADPAMPPLASLHAPRPAAVDTIFAQGDWSFGKVNGTPNAAVAALLRAVRPTWATRADHAAGVAAARLDPQVEGVIDRPGMFPFRVYPERPVAGQPFALWLTTSSCIVLIPTSYDDRVVRVDGNIVHVFVPELLTLCGVPPPGEFQTLLNMPALPAGEYTLHVTHYHTTPDIEPWLGEPLQFVVAPGVLAPPPVRVPTAGTVALLVLVAGVLFLLRGSVRRG